MTATLTRILAHATALALVLACASPAAAQYRPTPPSSVLLHELQKLRTVRSALYVAAHPDDENTRLIAWLANRELAETAYLSLTRGDGGQNLVGADLREGLGVIRTQELLAARRTDGGKQFFTRANDFGYSKHPDETLTFWDRDSILADMVWVIRRWQPDVIVTRFDPESAGRTHGHHTTSALLAVEAQALAADPQAFPEQLRRGVEPWSAERVFFNTSWWFYGSREAFAAADKSDLVEVDAGVYYPLLGLSNGEIAARSRSQHASQGFGSSASRGSQNEYLKLLAGEMPADRSDPFGGIPRGWSRLEGGAAVERVLAEAERAFDPEHPELIAEQLLTAHRLVEAMPPSRYRRTKLPALRRLIADCLGVYFEATAADSLATPGGEVTVAYELIDRSAGIPVRLRGLELERHGGLGAPDTTLPSNAALEGERTFARAQPLPSSPYWLRGEATEGMYAAPSYELRGEGENPPAFTATATLEVLGQTFPLSAPVLYRRTYPDRGEVYRPVLAVPETSVRFAEPVYLWPDGAAREVELEVKSFGASGAATVELGIPAGWRAEPRQQTVELSGAGDAQTVRFRVTPSAEASTRQLTARLIAGDTRAEAVAVRELRYGHIPLQAITSAASAKAIRLDLRRAGRRIGYVMGAGDAVPEALREVGYEVDLLGERELASVELGGYDAIVLGIRAYNTQDWLPRVNDRLLDYARAGGTVVVQYNTSRRLDMTPLAPYPLTLSRKRITVEGAPLRFLDADEPVLNRPNKLTERDFEGWVQERGLYFPDEWDDAYRPVLEGNDPGEEPLRGGLLVAPLGEGHYVYTGLSFFRELPAGVPGAYRLFVNLLEL